MQESICCVCAASARSHSKSVECWRPHLVDTQPAAPSRVLSLTECSALSLCEPVCAVNEVVCCADMC
jgi:hypothetical protein